MRAHAGCLLVPYRTLASARRKNEAKQARTELSTAEQARISIKLHLLITRLASSERRAAGATASIIT